MMKKLKHKSVFVASVIHAEGKMKYPHRLNNQVLGYYSDLRSAALSLRSKRAWHRNADFPFKLYVIREYVLNRESDDEWQLKVYDGAGRLYGKYQWYKLFMGRDKKDRKFSLGQLVEFIDWRNDGTFLNVGIVTGLPPSKKSVRKITRDHSGVQLTSSEDCYRLLTGYGKHKLTGSQECYLFPLSGNIDEKIEKRMIMEYEKK